MALASVNDIEIDPRTMAWIQFSITLSSVYGPRALMFYLRKKAEAEAANAKREQKTAPA